MAVIRRLHVPLLAPEGIIPYLGAPHHWKEGRSAKSLINSWWTANDIPASIRRLLDSVAEWRDAELIDAFAERCTDLRDGRPSHSQSDLLAIVGVATGTAILSIEAKVNEGFDKTVGEWIGNGSEGKSIRLGQLKTLLGINEQVDHLRYQLFHRTAAAIIEARRYRTNQAAMIVQSWCPHRSSFGDFATFCSALGKSPPAANQLSEPILLNGVALRLGWSAEAG